MSASDPKTPPIISEPFNSPTDRIDTLVKMINTIEARVLRIEKGLIAAGGDEPASSPPTKPKTES